MLGTFIIIISKICCLKKSKYKQTQPNHLISNGVVDILNLIPTSIIIYV